METGQRLAPPMNQRAGNLKARLLAFLAFSLTGCVAASVLALMHSDYPAIGGAALVGASLVLFPPLAIGFVCGRGNCRAFCFGAAFPAFAAFRSAASTLASLLKSLPPQWPPEFANLDERMLVEADRVLGAAILAAIALGYFSVAVVWLDERLRSAGVRPRRQFGLKTVFVLTTLAAFAASAASRISPANQYQFYLIVFCTGCVATAVAGLYIAALLVPPLTVSVSRKLPSKAERNPR